MVHIGYTYLLKRAQKTVLGLFRNFITEIHMHRNRTAPQAMSISMQHVSPNNTNNKWHPQGHMTALPVFNSCRN